MASLTMTSARDGGALIVGGAILLFRSRPAPEPGAKQLGAGALASLERHPAGQNPNW